MNILAFFAHPDDETMLAGGTLALLAEDGAAVHYLCATRGEGGELGEPPRCAREELGAVREAELRCAVQALGGVSLQFLDYIDPLVGEGDALFSYCEDGEQVAGQLAGSIRKLRPAALFTHGTNGEYGHPAHVFSHQAARRAIEMAGAPRPAWFSVSASFPEHPRPFLTNADEPADLVVDITPVLAQKTRAALCHRTQHALFVRRLSQETGRQMRVEEVIIPLEGIHRVAGGDGTEDVLAVLEPWKMKAQGSAGE